MDSMVSMETVSVYVQMNALKQVIRSDVQLIKQNIYTLPVFILMMMMKPVSFLLKPPNLKPSPLNSGFWGRSLTIMPLAPSSGQTKFFAPLLVRNVEVKSSGSKKNSYFGFLE